MSIYQHFGPRLADWQGRARVLKRQSWLQENAGALEQLVQYTVQAARVAKIGARQLANIASGAAHSSRRPILVTLFKVLAKATERRVCNFNAQAFANTGWAFVTASQSDALLFKALAKAAKRRMCNFNAQDFANTVWAFATARKSDALLFKALA